MQERDFKPYNSISALTLGGGGLGQVWGETTREEAIATVNLAIEKASSSVQRKGTQSSYSSSSE